MSQGGKEDTLVWWPQQHSHWRISQHLEASLQALLLIPLSGIPFPPTCFLMETHWSDRGLLLPSWALLGPCVSFGPSLPPKSAFPLKSYGWCPLLQHTEASRTSGLLHPLHLCSVIPGGCSPRHIRFPPWGTASLPWKSLAPLCLFSPTVLHGASHSGDPHWPCILGSLTFTHVYIQNVMEKQEL